MYITVTRSDDVIVGTGKTPVESLEDAWTWTHEGDLTTYPCTPMLHKMVLRYGGDVVYYLDHEGVARLLV